MAQPQVQASGPLLAPMTLDFDKGGVHIREDVLFDLRGHTTPKEVAAKIGAKHRLLPEEEKALELQIAEHCLRGFGKASVGQPVVSIVLQVPLGHDYFFIDKLACDLNNPRFSAEMYTAAICRDLGLGWLHLQVIAKALRAKLEACRQELKSGGGGKVQVVPPMPLVKRERPSSYPTVIRVKKRAKAEPAAEGQQLGAQAGPAAGAAAGSGAAAAGPAAVKAERLDGAEGGGTAAATKVKVEDPGTAAAVGAAAAAAGGSAQAAAAPEAVKEEQAIKDEPASSSEESDMPALDV